MPTTTSSKRRSSYLAASAGLLLTLAVVRFPEAAFDASLEGLRLWFDVVLPALLPFFAMAEILAGLGVIHAIGVLLEPIMRPAFRIPGVGGFAVAMGLVSGYPLGAKITGRMRRDGMCSREEAERLVSFANTADPLFIVGAVAIGMFGLPQIGMALVAGHYVAVLVVGFLMRYHAKGTMAIERQRPKGSIFRRSLDALTEARRRDRRPFGELLGDAIKESMNSMLFIGGCLMMFAVLIRILEVTGAMELLAVPFAWSARLIGASAELAPAIVKGFAEITIGAQAASQATASLFERTVVAGGIVAWSGMSVHAQVAAMLHGTDIRMTPYFFARLMHAVLAAGFTALLFHPMGSAAQAVSAVAALGTTSITMPIWIQWGLMAAGMVGLTCALLALSLGLHAANKIKVVLFRV